MPGPYDTYTSPLATRNASPEMLRLWSARHKFNTWRRIWLAVAEAMHEVTRDDASPLVTKEQVEELRAVVERGITDEEIGKAEEYERELRHDVMAHVHALGDSCPKARPIIHLGMTSQDVVCNADLLVINEAIELLEVKHAKCIDAFARFATQHAHTPTLAFTHFQPAQPTTVGRRAAGWSADIHHAYSDYFDLSCCAHWLLRGLRGATGTQASYLALFNGDAASVDQLEARVLRAIVPDDQRGVPFDVAALRNREAESLARSREALAYMQAVDPEQSQTIGRLGRNIEKRGQERSDAELLHEHALFRIEACSFDLQGQTYPRVFDTRVLGRLAATAAVLHKIATDIRLLSNRKEIDEPFEDKQIGSSAMPYKRNPMRCERICGLTRFVMNLAGNAYDTAATQWLERTLDDSSNRRLSLPEAFLALDGALDLMHNVASGLVVHEAMVRRNLMAELPFLATENILMACVKLGGDRQDYHERIRRHAQEAGLRVKQQGLDNDLLDRLRADPAFRSKARGGSLDGEIDWDGLMDPMKYVGRSVEQTERFIREVVEPLREQYAEAITLLGESGPRV